jgi:hypothetical protein
VLCGGLVWCAVQGSVPALRPGRWYVAIYGLDIPLGERKTWTVSVSKGGGYDYTYALLLTLLLPFGMGGLFLVVFHGWLVSTDAFSLQPPDFHLIEPITNKPMVDARTGQRMIDPAHPSQRRACTWTAFVELLEMWFTGRTQRGFSFSFHTLIIGTAFAVGTDRAEQSGTAHTIAHAQRRVCLLTLVCSCVWLLSVACAVC